MFDWNLIELVDEETQERSNYKIDVTLTARSNPHRVSYSPGEVT